MLFTEGCCGVTRMDNKPVVLRIPAELFEAIEARANATGQSMTDVVLEALNEVYGNPQT